jgi:hypothetical protein
VWWQAVAGESFEQVFVHVPHAHEQKAFPRGNHTDDDDDDENNDDDDGDDCDD